MANIFGLATSRRVWSRTDRTTPAERAQIEEFMRTRGATKCDPAPNVLVPKSAFAEKKD